MLSFQKTKKDTLQKMKRVQDLPYSEKVECLFDCIVGFSDGFKQEIHQGDLEQGLSDFKSRCKRWWFSNGGSQKCYQRGLFSNS